MGYRDGRQRWEIEMGDRDGRFIQEIAMGYSDGRQRWEIEMGEGDGR